jgi:hypothetical protein
MLNARNVRFSLFFRRLSSGKPINPIVLWTLTHFQPTQAGHNPKIKFLGYNLTVTTLKILTRLKILGCNPNWVKFLG